MLLQQTIENLKALRLKGMAKALEQQSQNPDIQSLTFEERLGLMVDFQLTVKADSRIQKLVTAAHLIEDACIENIDLEGVTGIDRKTLLSLARGDWIRRRQSIMLIGPTGMRQSQSDYTHGHELNITFLLPERVQFLLSSFLTFMVF